MFNETIKKWYYRVSRDEKINFFPNANVTRKLYTTSDTILRDGYHAPFCSILLRVLALGKLKEASEIGWLENFNRSESGFRANANDVRPLKKAKV